MNTLEETQKRHNQQHYLLECPYCKTKLVVPQNELTKQLYKPVEQEYEYWELGGGGEKKIGRHMVSSDPSRDTYKDIKCCYCGHVWDIPVQEMYERRCNPDGTQRLVFELTEEETEAARTFREQHGHTEELKKENKLVFTALGQQFTYHITPGGLGNTVSITCNKCKETKDLTDIENW